MNFKSQALALAVAGAVLLGCAREGTMLVPQSVFPKEDFSEKPDDFTVFNPKVDILFVIDDSGSMDDAQNNLRRNAHIFADEISRMSILDFHIGVTTTDMSGCSPTGNGRNCGQLTGDPVFIQKSTPNLVDVLSNRMVLGTSGSASEVMFTPTIAALSGPLDKTVNAGFYRQDAFLAVIFLTDADDQSKTSAQDLYRFLVNKKMNADKVLAYGVIRTKAEANTTCRSAYETVNGYLESFLGMVVNAGKNQDNILSFCTPDYGTKLAEFARDIVKRSAGTVKLSRVPNVKTIKVKFGTQVIPNDLKRGWVYEPSTNSILLAEDIDWDLTQTGAGLVVDFEVIDMVPRR